ncbi:MAG TPA: SUMF1/EgtB/PvdO family nonheme iron enzyme [Chitinophagaceae bacterium]|nr:SUMF1/EgtB/PvdO family nonheme iron enzyme [Chitinophagaceae bacterium]
MKASFLFSFFSLSLFSGIAQSGSDTFSVQKTVIPGSSVSFTMLPVPGGRFTMGSPAGEAGRKENEGPQKQITIDPFWMGANEVTYDEFLLFFNDQETSTNEDADAVTRPTPQYIDLSWGMGKQGGYPVNSMSQRTALMYCRWLYKKTGIFYRLPTEAEWEYACRAGSGDAYYFGNDAKVLKEYAWFSDNSKDKYHKTGQKKPNAWGFYDMLGNVAEWTLDQYDDKYFSNLPQDASNPLIKPATLYPRSVRGGSYMDKPDALRCAARSHSESSWNRRDPQIPKSKWWLTDAMGVGFRLVRPLKTPDADSINAFFNQYLAEEE